MKKNGAIFGSHPGCPPAERARRRRRGGEARSRADELQALQAEVKRLAQELEAMKAKTAKAEAVPVAAQVADTSALAERLDVVEIQQKDAVVMGDVPTVPGPGHGRCDPAVRVRGAELRARVRTR